MVSPAFPFVGKRLDLDGLGLHYIDEGQGQVVLCLHGNPTWSYFYRGLIAEMMTTHRVIVPDHIGCGRSDKPTRDRYPYTLARRIDDIDALIRHVVPGEPIALVVHDWGGMIGSAWAVRNASLVSRLVAMNTAAFPLPAGKRLPWQLSVGRNRIVGPLLIRGLNLFCRGAASGCVVRRPLDPEARAQFLAPYDSWAHRVAVDQFVATIPLSPGDPGFDIVSATAEGLCQLSDRPILLPWGLRDFVFDGDFLAEWQRRFPAARAIALADAGHYLLEDAGDELIPEIAQFLRS